MHEAWNTCWQGSVRSCSPVEYGSRHSVHSKAEELPEWYGRERLPASFPLLLLLLLLLLSPAVLSSSTASSVHPLAVVIGAIVGADPPGDGGAWPSWPASYAMRSALCRSRTIYHDRGRSSCRFLRCLALIERCASAAGLQPRAGWPMILVAGLFVVGNHHLCFARARVSAHHPPEAKA